MQPSKTSERPLRSVLICHAESSLNREAVARWMASYSDLAAIVVIEEHGRHARTRVRREVQRIGLLRFLDVIAFRLYYALRYARTDQRWLDDQLQAVKARFADVPPTTRVFRTENPSSVETQNFLREIQPDFIVARCKRILHERIFSIPAHGTFVLHPGVCPEYRNAHGAFWALARRDLDRVGLTLLKIDKGVDTGPVYGYFSYDFDELTESHIVVMTRLVLDNFDAIRDRLLEVIAGRATPIDTRGRSSAVWGQPWLTSYLKWKRDAKRRRNASLVARVP